MEYINYIRWRSSCVLQLLVHQVNSANWLFLNYSNGLTQKNIVALVRNPEKASDLSSKGIEVRAFDYGHDADKLSVQLAGIDKLLLISSSEVGQRTVQHQNVINAAKLADVKFIIYTSLLNADTSPLLLAQEHVETEQYLKKIGYPIYAIT